MDWFPSDPAVQPFSANFLEPRIGFHFQTGENDLRLDIGSSRDIFHYSEGNETFSAGADFFTYTKLRGEKDFHFPVDAVDYLFGINAAYKKEHKEYTYGIRMRISHISAHFVDGHFDTGSQSWRDGLAPRVYSREFIELIPFYQTGMLRVYGGLSYLFHVSPNELGKQIYHLGFDAYFDQWSFYGITPFAAYDYKLEDVYAKGSVHSVGLGLKAGESRGAGFRVELTYFSGNSIHGEYFDVYEEYVSLGFNIDI
jgi:hypothetical protein